MITGDQARALKKENQEYKEALLRLEAYNLKTNPTKKIIGIHKKIEQALQDDQDFAFFGCKVTEADLMRVYFESIGFKIKRQNSVAGEEIYKITW